MTYSYGAEFDVRWLRHVQRHVVEEIVPFDFPLERWSNEGCELVGYTLVRGGYPFRRIWLIGPGEQRDRNSCVYGSPSHKAGRDRPLSAQEQAADEERQKYWANKKKKWWQIWRHK